jgi:hypothetical protein
VALSIVALTDYMVQFVRHKPISGCILQINFIEGILLPELVLDRWEFFLHSFVAHIDECGCHVSHPSPVAFKLEQVLQIDVVLNWYLNIPTSLHCYSVISDIDASKVDTTA